MTEQRRKLLEEFDQWFNSKPNKRIMAAECANIAERYAAEQLLLHNVVVPKGTLSNLDEAIKKAKPNMDKIKDVDKHLDDIR